MTYASTVPVHSGDGTGLSVPGGRRASVICIATNSKNISWRALLCGFLAIVMLVLAVPIAAAHGDIAPEVMTGSAQQVISHSQGQSDKQLPPHGLSGQHCAACPCAHAFFASSAPDVPLCRELSAVSYQVHSENDAAGFIPAPLRKPPRV